MKVGSVPFVNANPLVEGLAEGGVEVIFAMPSKLPSRLDSGELDAVLASSFDALTTPNRRVAWGVCIGSFGPADSVRLFSRVPFEQIKTLALDSSSLTSNSLAQVVLAELYGVRPDTSVAEPDLTAMLQDFDAGILIGDRGMMAGGEGLHILDLGEAWTRLTGLPFVWALWIGLERLEHELVATLNQAHNTWLERRSWRIPQIAEGSGWTEIQTARYLEQTMRYQLGENEWRGLIKFRDLLVKYDFATEPIQPTVVMPSGDLARMQ
ncbi:MAG: menaquinone biosynthesis protein [Fimbriimonadaceae bacterium]